MAMKVTFVVVDVCIQYPTHDFLMVDEGGCTISSFGTGYQITSLWQYNLGSIKVPQPQAHLMISNIEGGDSAHMGDKWETRALFHELHRQKNGQPPTDV